MIVVIGLSPTVQRTLRFAGALDLGQVNRAVEAHTTALIRIGMREMNDCAVCG